MNSSKTETCLRETQVFRESTRLQHNIETLSELVSALEERLRSVTRAEPEENTKEQPIPEVVPLANEIRNMSSRVESIYQKVDRLPERLEI